MSNPIKALGRVFKKVISVVKKVALPALAIGAVVLTGGAALGLLPSVGSLAGSLGLSAGLTSVLTSAATSATIGAGLSAVTGGSILKGATAGLITGGVLGGANAALGAAKGLGNAAQAAGAGGNTASTAASFADKVAGAPGLDVISNGSLANAGSAVASSSAGGLGMAGKVGGLAASSGAGTALIDPVVSSVAPSASGGGLMGFLNKNPIMGGMVIQGLGQGLMANEQNKAAQRERDQIAANYGDTSGLPQYQSQGNDYARAADVFNSAIYAGKKATYDPKTGRIQVGNG